MSEENPNIKAVGPVGTYQVCLKSGATVVLEGVDLWVYAPMPNPPNPIEPWHYYFQRAGERVSFTPHFVNKAGFGEIDLDVVIDAVFRLK